jgi:hypothetical protein
MATLKASVDLPVELAREIDALVGEDHRGEFLVETAEKEIRRRKLLAFLDREEPAWSDENHPDIAELGSAEWVRRLRSESSVRLAGRDENLDSA